MGEYLKRGVPVVGAMMGAFVGFGESIGGDEIESGVGEGIGQEEIGSQEIGCDE